MDPATIALIAQLLALTTQGVTSLITAKQTAEANQAQSMDTNYSEALGHFQNVANHATAALAALAAGTPVPEASPVVDEPAAAPAATTETAVTQVPAASTTTLIPAAPAPATTIQPVAVAAANQS